MSDTKELNLNELEKAVGGKGYVPSGGIKDRPDASQIPAGCTVHQITATDNLTRIAAFYKTTIKAIMDRNPSIKDKNLLRTGYFLIVPDNR